MEGVKSMRAKCMQENNKIYRFKQTCYINSIFLEIFGIIIYS